MRAGNPARAGTAAAAALAGRRQRPARQPAWRAMSRPMRMPSRFSAKRARSIPDWAKHIDLYPETARRALATAQTIKPEIFAQACEQVAAIANAFEEICADIDAVIGPTLPVLPPLVGVRRMRLNGQEQPVLSILVAETCLANVTGAPALSMPLPSGCRTGRQHSNSCIPQSRRSRIRGGARVATRDRRLNM